MTHLLALAGVFGISFSAVFVRLARVSPVTATFFRAAYAIPILALAWLRVRGHDRRSRRDHLLAGGAGLILAVDLALWHASIAFIGAGLSTVIANVQVLFVALAAWALYGERPSGADVVTIVVVLAGVALSSGAGGRGAYGASPGTGAVLGVLAGASYAAFLLVFRAAMPPGAPLVGPLLDLTVGTAIGGLICAAVDPHFSLAITWPSHAWLFLLAVISQVIGWLLIASALPRLPALETSILLLGQPALTVVWGVFLFDERLSTIQWLGAGVVLGGVLLISLLRAARHSTPSKALQ